jgi:hypothetical protein
MNKRQAIAITFIIISVFLGTVFFTDIHQPENPGGYFEISYYQQFGPLAICVALFIAGINLFAGQKKSNFSLAVFAFTVLLDIIFHFSGFFASAVPLYAMIIFFVCALIALWISFSNAFNLGKITWRGAIGSIVLSMLIEFYFYYSWGFYD